MKPIDYDLKGNPIYDPLDLMVHRAVLPVFDMERMKRALSGTSVEIPKGLSREEMRKFLIKNGGKS